MSAVLSDAPWEHCDRGIRHGIHNGFPPFGFKAKPRIALLQWPEGSILYAKLTCASVRMIALNGGMPSDSKREYQFSEDSLSNAAARLTSSSIGTSSIRVAIPQ